jgi:hypothetical protein
MRLGFLAKVWLVLVVLCTATSSALAAEPATAPAAATTLSAEEAACERVEVAEALVSSALDLTATAAGAPVPRPLPLLPDALLCARGGMAVDCELHDPASRPRAPSPPASATPDVVSDTEPEPPAPAATRLAAGLHALGSARPGFARGLERPPRA